MAILGLNLQILTTNITTGRYIDATAACVQAVGACTSIMSCLRFAAIV